MNNDVDYTIALNSLGWETLEVQRKKAKAKLMFKLLNNLGPKSLTKLFTKKREVTSVIFIHTKLFLSILAGHVANITLSLFAVKYLLYNTSCGRQISFCLNFEATYR